MKVERKNASTGSLGGKSTKGKKTRPCHCPHPVGEKSDLGFKGNVPLESKKEKQKSKARECFMGRMSR